MRWCETDIKISRLYQEAASEFGPSCLFQELEQKNMNCIQKYVIIYIIYVSIYLFVSLFTLYDW